MSTENDGSFFRARYVIPAIWGVLGALLVLVVNNFINERKVAREGAPHFVAVNDPTKKDTLIVLSRDEAAFRVLQSIDSNSRSRSAAPVVAPLEEAATTGEPVTFKTGSALQTGAAFDNERENAGRRLPKNGPLVAMARNEKDLKFAAQLLGTWQYQGRPGAYGRVATYSADGLIFLSHDDGHSRRGRWWVSEGVLYRRFFQYDGHPNDENIANDYFQIVSVDDSSFDFRSYGNTVQRGVRVR